MSANPSNHAKPWHHTASGFRNPPGSRHMTPDAGTYWRFIGRMLRNARKPQVLPPGHALSADEALAGWRALEGQGPALMWLGHAAFLLRLGGKTVLLDPYLGEEAGPVRGMSPKRFVAPGLTPETLPPIDVVAISHNHYDHLCTDTLKRLPNRAGISMVVPLKLGAFFKPYGFGQVIELDWHDRHEADGLAITALPAVHWSKRTAFDANRSLWAGFALAGEGQKLCFTGDTAYHETLFREIGERHGPFDHALVPIGAYEPRAIMAGHHANPEEGVALGRDLGARRLVAMHWGTVMLTDEPPFEPPGRFRQAARDAGYAEEDAWVMRIGETRLLTPRPTN
ncbi:MBL fold metallo-hydrolase [Ferrovibrio sp. MS7]|uniref:MBL fold metallo-hydrolase n=1 Tax=Ferrovibrio plantarum TaxID=3119164 RepID=UPI0031355A92